MILPGVIAAALMRRYFDANVAVTIPKQIVRSPINAGAVVIPKQIVEGEGTVVVAVDPPTNLTPPVIEFAD